MDIDIARINSALGRATELLRRTYSNSAQYAGGGWYHRLESPEPGPTATAIGLQAFVECGLSFDKVNSCMDYLRARQVRSDRKHFDGGWPTNTSQGIAVVDATATILRSLQITRCGQRDDSPNIERAIAWLVNNQNPDGGWATVKGNNSRLWLTCLALRALAENNPYEAALWRGVDWLSTNEDKGGGWGVVPGQAPTVTHTSIALIALSDVWSGGAGVDLARSYEWLEANLCADEIDDKDARVESYNASAMVDGTVRATWQTTLNHYGTPMAVSALLRRPDSVPAKPVAKAVNTMLDRQHIGGYWPDPQGGRGVTIWAIWPFIQAFLDVKRLSAVRANDIVRLGDGVVLVHRKGVEQRQILAVARAGRVSAAQLLARYWATVLLTFSVVAGMLAVILGAFEWKDFGLGVALPVGLFLLQEFRQRRGRG